MTRETLIAFMVLAVAGTALGCSMSETELAALTDLYEQCGGSKWNFVSTQLWFGGEDPCNWEGVVCACSGGIAHVTSLDLFGAGLVGELPDSIGDLAWMVHLVLEDNHLTGRVPASIFGNMQQLTILNIAYNDFTEPLPAVLGLCSRLERLIADYANLPGALPESIGNLQYLERVTINFNHMNGTIPAAIGHLPLLEIFEAEANNFTGTLPDDMTAWNKLQTLVLCRNELSGTIPNSFQYMPNLTRLDLEDNNFTGQFPSSITAVSGIYHVNLANNNLEGEIPAMSLSRLNYFDISGNSFTGDLSGLDCPFAQSFYVNDNYFTGDVPDWLMSGPPNHYYSLANNLLNCPLPSYCSAEGNSLCEPCF